MKIYTKTRDKGKTSLYDGKRISKDDILVEAYGTVDELGSRLGLCKHYVDHKDLFKALEIIQNKLFVVTTNLATENIDNVVHRMQASDISYLESLIDTYMMPQTHFILPGSSKGAAHMHVARTVCRRAERLIVGIPDQVDPLVLQYINRLSDTLYAFGCHLESSETQVTYYSYHHIDLKL